MCKLKEALDRALNMYNDMITALPAERETFLLAKLALEEDKQALKGIEIDAWLYPTPIEGPNAEHRKAMHQSRMRESERAKEISDGIPIAEAALVRHQHDLEHLEMTTKLARMVVHACTSGMMIIERGSDGE